MHGSLSKFQRPHHGEQESSQEWYVESDWGILNLNILNQVQVGWHLVNFDASGNLNSKCSYIADGAGFEYL